MINKMKNINKKELSFLCILAEVVVVSPENYFEIGNTIRECLNYNYSKLFGDTINELLDLSITLSANEEERKQVIKKISAISSDTNKRQAQQTAGNLLRWALENKKGL